MDSTSNTLGGAHVPKSPEEWPSFLRSYADGDWKTGDTCSPVYDSSGSTDSTPVGDQSDTTWNDSVPYETYDYHLYPSTHISKETAERVRQFVIAKDYLPPPRSPLEEHRLECIKQYDIYSEAQTTNIQRAVDVIAAFFPTALVTFTLFDGRKQLFVAMGGDQSYIDRYGLVLRQPIPAHNSLCGHSVLRRDQVMFIPNLRHDFRFRSNPYSNAGISSYIGSPVSLLLDPLFGQQASDLRVGIGSLNVLFIDGVLKKLADKDRMIVENITRMLEAQLRGTWEGVIRTREGMMRYAVSDLIEASFVKEKKRQETESDSKSLAKTQKRADADFVHLAQLALTKVTQICSALSGVTLVDTQDRSGDKYLRLPHHESKCVEQKSKTAWTLPDTLPFSLFDPSSSQVRFDKTTAPSGLEDSLPPDTRSHIVMPFFAGDRPQLAIVATSRGEGISESDVSFVRSVGSIMLAKRVQDMAVEADKAKTAFLSSISHELRTPLHSLMTALGLARVAIDVEDYDEVKSVLETVRSSGVTLQTILNDVLDFGKLNSIFRPDPIVLAKVNIVMIVKHAIAMSLDQYSDFEAGFSVRLEYEDEDWVVELDTAKYSRILLNGLTNALKFCKNGPIVLSLSASGNEIITTITDSGLGFDDSTLPHLLEPFTKGHDYAPGAGLGLHIATRILEQVGGTLQIRSALGKGTVFEAAMPVSISHMPPPVGPGSKRKKKSQIMKEIALADPIALQALAITQSEAVSPDLPTPPLRVMIVDDNLICRRILTKALKRSATPILTQEADDGQVAVDLYPTFKPELVLTDVSMPIMDGVTAAQHMRRIGSEKGFAPCKVYAITGLGLSDPRLKAAGLLGSAALDGWLIKGQDDAASINRIISDLWKEKTAE